MSIVVIVVLVLAMLGCGVLTLLGFRPAPPLAQFTPDRSAAPRRFSQPPDEVQVAYVGAVSRAPGMTLVEQVPGLLYVDSRPTARILGGDFGVVLRLLFEHGDQGGTVVRVDALAKFGTTKGSTLRELERALRMRAKTLGVSELVC